MTEHMLPVVIRESLIAARDQDVATTDEAIAIIKEEVKHVAATMEERWVREFARFMLDRIVDNRIGRDLPKMRETPPPSIR
jgi:hypothetical protein